MGQSVKRLELDTMMRSVANVVKMYVRSAAEPLIDRIAALEARTPEKGDKGETGKDGVPGRDGKDGIDGRDGLDGKAGPAGSGGAPGEKGAEGPRGLQGEPGRDGRDGQPGRDGANGKDGQNGQNGADGKDGAPGLNGKDGFSLQDFNAHLEDDGRVLVLSFGTGEAKKEFRLTTGVPVYRGVYKEGHTYERSDRVTWGGSEWHANEETSAKPGDGSKAWTLAVKKGRDGRDGDRGPPGERGAQGFPGRDRT